MRVFRFGSLRLKLKDLLCRYRIKEWKLKMAEERRPPVRLWRFSAFGVK